MDGTSRPFVQAALVTLHSNFLSNLSLKALLFFVFYHYTVSKDSADFLIITDITDTI
jgi:hypothetical protein